MAQNNPGRPQQPQRDQQRSSNPSQRDESQRSANPFGGNNKPSQGGTQGQRPQDERRK